MKARRVTVDLIKKCDEKGRRLLSGEDVSADVERAEVRDVEEKHGVSFRYEPF